MRDTSNKERDTETGNDYMFARYYNSATGRFLSPDWSAKYEPVPYAKLGDPQSLNLYSYVYNNPISNADTDGHEVKVLTALALQRVQSTVPSDVRSQVTAGENGVLNRAAIDGIKSDDSNVQLLKQAVDASATIEVNTGSSVQGGQPSGPDGVVGIPFSYESVATQQAEVKAAGGDPSGVTIPSVYDGYTQTAAQSPSGNIRVTVADGTGATATEPSADLASTTAHELYGHATPLAKGQPWQHDNGGPVDKKIKAIEDHTKDLN
jgi:RHS repeat-associated protein